MQVVVVGTGYVGLVSGVCFSDFGHQVICVDKDESKIDVLNNGGVPIYEPELDTLLAKNVKEGRLAFTTELADAVKSADVVFIAVGTPARRGDGHADLSFVYAVAEEVAAIIENYTVIVTKSTVPVGTGDEVEAIIRKIRPDTDFDVVSNPEFLREGAAIDDFKRPDRVVVGTDSERAREVMRRLYRPLYINETPIIFTSRRTSELIKYAANAFLATKITFINEMADLCEKVGANVQEVARGMGLDGRIGNKFLHAGPGYGGSCFPKDTLAIMRTASEVDAPLTIVEAVVTANSRRQIRMADKVIDACAGSVKGKTIAILGLAFKPDTDDMRDSPAITIIDKLHEKGAHIRAYDPEAMEEAKKLLSNITYCSDAYDCAAGADVLVIVTEWNSFRSLDFAQLKSVMNTSSLVDLRNIYSAGEVNDQGFSYTSVGRPSS